MNKKVVIDTDILVDFEHAKALWLSEILDGKRKLIPVLPTIVVSEYWASQRISKPDAQKSAEELLAVFRKQNFTEDIAKVMGELMRFKSYPSGASVSDLIVASTALYLDTPLATRNLSHYQGIANLKFFKP